MTTALDRYNAAHQREYTEEQVANLPQTDKVFDRPAIEFDNHEWRQEGYMITDVCSPSRADCQNVGIPIPTGKMLVKTNGRYDIVDEGGQTR